MEHHDGEQLCPEMRTVLQAILAEQWMKLHSATTSAGCSRGDNFFGGVLRVTSLVKPFSGGELREMQFIFKCPPTNKKWREDLKTVKYTRNETAFYQEVLPKLKRFCQERARNEEFAANFLKVPKCFRAVCDTEFDVIVLEDLKVQGFVMTERMPGMDAAHCLLALKELGRYHGMSLAMKALRSTDFNIIKDSVKEIFFFEDGRPQFSTVHFPCEAALKMMISRFPDGKYANKLEKITTDFFDKMMELCSTESPLSVITHGDVSINNLLFKYNAEGSPVDVRFLDFQVSRYASLATDLSYLMYCSTTQSLRREHWDTLMDAYLASVQQTLLALAAPPDLLSKSQLEDEMRRFGRFGIGMALMVIPLFTSNPEDHPSMDTGMEFFDNFHKNTYKNELCCTRITDAVQDAIERGFFD